MNNSLETTAALERLFRTYPSFAQGSTPEELMRDRVEKAKVYLEAIEPYDIRDINAAVASFLRGAAPGHNPAFTPSAPQVGAETRRVMNLRLESEHRDRLRTPALPPPDIEHTPESRERMKAILEAGVANLQSVSLPENEAEAKRSKDQWDQVNARFYPDMSPDAMRKRLGFTVGDPEDHEAAA